MKKLLSFLLAVILLISLCACAKPQEATPSESAYGESEPKAQEVESSSEESELAKEDTTELKCYPQIGASGDYLVLNNYLYAFQDGGINCYDSEGNLVYEKSFQGMRENDIYEYNDGIYPTENGILYMYYKPSGGGYSCCLEAIGNDGETLWKLNLGEWGEVRGAVSDKNDGLLILINRHRWDGGGITVLNINKDGQTTDLDNMVADDTGYIDRGTNALAYNSQTGELYGIFSEEDNIDNDKRLFFKMNLTENTYTQVDLVGFYYYVTLDEATNTVYAHSRTELSVFDSELNLIRTHSYEYCKNVFPLSGGKYMVYHSGEGFHEGHTVDIYDKNGGLLTQVDLGCNVLTITPFKNGFVAQTSYLGMGSVFKYDYNGNLLYEIPLDTDNTYCHIFDYNTVFCNP